VKVVVNGVQIEVPDGTPLTIGADGGVKIGQVEPVVEGPVFSPRKSLEMYLGRKTVESTYRSVTTGVSMHLAEIDRERVRRATAQLDLPSISQPPLATLLPPCPALEYTNMVMKRKYTPIWECVWEVLAGGGWYNVGGIADRLGIGQGTTGTRRSYMPEYNQVSAVLLWANDQHMVVIRRVGMGKRFWQYAEPSWAKEHMTSAEVFRAKKSIKLE
jgi:hypothetical protein